MLLRRSSFVHQIPVGEGRILIVHALTHMRLPADREVDALLTFFAQPRRVPEDCAALTALIPYSPDAIARAIEGLRERQVLTEQTPEQEMAAVTTRLSDTHGRDPAEMLTQYRREKQEGAASAYWAAGTTYGLRDLGTEARRVDVLLFGDCDIQMEADFLRRNAAERGIDLRVSASFPDDTRFAGDHKHDAIFIGALRARHRITDNTDDAPPHAAYIAAAHHMVQQLRTHSNAPILIDNLPEPTVQPLGMAEQGLRGHRTRFRYANVALAEWAATQTGVYIVDIAASLACAGQASLLDDGLVDFTHFGSSGWLLQRPASEKEAVHDIFPDTAPLADSIGGDPYGREKILSATHIDALVTVLGIGRKKCVILDLDGTLWPGVLAETGSPFAWTPEISGAFSYIGLYFGLHEALLCLKKRGVVLACVSKNDETTVRDLWKYPDHYPRQRLLTPDDFVTWRVNWNDKVDNIQSIADELGFALDSFLFIDDHPVERDRVRQRLPQVEVWGEDPFALRRLLLSDPRLQLPVITDEAATRSHLVKAQLDRQHLRAEIMDEASYIASLNIVCQIETLAADSPRLNRVEELFQRTTQFNTTGRQCAQNELRAFIQNPEACVFTLDVSDRFGAHGLVGAAVICDGEILGLAISCRVLGMGVEHQFMRHIIASVPVMCGRIIPTVRNNPVRNLYRDHGFTLSDETLWIFPTA